MSKESHVDSLFLYHNERGLDLGTFYVSSCIAIEAAQCLVSLRRSYTDTSTYAGAHTRAQCVWRSLIHIWRFVMLTGIRMQITVESSIVIGRLCCYFYLCPGQNDKIPELCLMRPCKRSYSYLRICSLQANFHAWLRCHDNTCLARPSPLDRQDVLELASLHTWISS